MRKRTIQLIRRPELRVSVFALAISLFVFAFFNIRENINWTILIIGLVMIAFFALTFYKSKSSLTTDTKPESNNKEVFSNQEITVEIIQTETISETIGQELSDKIDKALFSSGKSILISDELIAEVDKIMLAPTIQLSEEYINNIEKTYLELPPTQRLIITSLYTSHKPQIAIDELFNYFLKEQPGVIKSRGELHYRVKDLAHNGLFETKSVGQKTTIVICIPNVGHALNRRKQILT